MVDQDFKNALNTAVLSWLHFHYPLPCLQQLMCLVPMKSLRMYQIPPPIPIPLGRKQNLCQEFPFKCASVTHTLIHLKKLKVVNVGLSVTQNIYIQPLCHNQRMAVYKYKTGSDGKESSCSVQDLGLIPGSQRSPGEGNCNPLQYSFQDGGAQCPRGRKESDTTERLHFTFHSIPARRIPRTEEAGGLESMGSQRAGHV